MLLFALVTIAVTWMHFAIRAMERRKLPELSGPKYLPELEELVEVERAVEASKAAAEAAVAALRKARRAPHSAQG
jgi:NNP family nitrate/nitrite transporter-like MFS transporter